MQSSRAQKEMRHGSAQEGMVPRHYYAKGGSNVYNQSRFQDDWDTRQMPRNRYAEGGEVDKWMQDVHPKKGALHKAMHIPMGKKIPTSALEKETHSKSKLMRKRANLALRYRGD